jgi:serine/threonine-protein kinase
VCSKCRSGAPSSSSHSCCSVFPLVLLFSWIYELTPEGLKKQHEVDRAGSITQQTGRKIDYAIGVLAVLAIVLVVADRFVPREHVLTLHGAGAVDAPANASVVAMAPQPERSGKSIAVLPFLDLSPGKDQEYFTDGISEELLNLLAQIPELAVTGRTSSFQFKNRNEDLRIIGQKLNVAHILEGSVRKSGDQIRLTAQLIRAADGTHLWSDSYDRKLDDIFAVQDEVAGEVVRALRVTLLGDQLPARSTTTDIEAHSLYLQGKFFADRRGPDDLEKSVDYLKRAIERDPEFAVAWAELAGTYRELANWAGGLGTGNWIKSAEAAQQAISIAPDLADGYVALGFVTLGQKWDWDLGAAQIARARQLDPANPSAVRAAANLAMSLGEFDRAIEILQRLVEREPLSSRVHQNLALALRNAGRLAEAEQAMRKALELSPETGNVAALLAGILVLQGEPAAALVALENESDEFWKAATLPIALHALGRDDESLQATRLLAEKFGAVGPYQVAEVHAFRGETSQALDWLERGYELRDPGLIEIKGDPFLRAIESEPRYRRMLRKLKLPA